MGQTEFTFDRFGKEITLKVGQKVQAISYHEDEPDCTWTGYKRTSEEIKTDPPFTPVKLGVVVGDAGVHPYRMGRYGKSQYLLVKFADYKLPKPIPISCLEDAAEAAEKTFFKLKRDIHLLGQKGYDTESFQYLVNMANKAKAFAESNLDYETVPPIITRYSEERNEKACSQGKHARNNIFVWLSNAFRSFKGLPPRNH